MKTKILFIFLFLFLLNPVVYSAKWTVMVYLDGDNNLESAAIGDFLEMSSVGSDTNINIIVQFDRIAGYNDSYGDWTDCRRYYVYSGANPDRTNSSNTLTYNMSIGEVNMGDPETLIEFVDWAVNTYPANYYYLILWNHGYSWLKSKTDFTVQDICEDYSSVYDSIGVANGELEYAIAQIKNKVLGGNKIEIVGFDACLMANWEIAYLLKDYAYYLVASEAEEPEDGWAYDVFLSSLKLSSGNMTPEELGNETVKTYAESFTDPSYDFITLSNVNLNQIPSFSTDFNTLVYSLITSSSPEIYSEVVLSRNNSRSFWNNINYDQGKFLENLTTYLSDNELRNLALNALNRYALCISTSCGDNATGLTLYFPDNYTKIYSNLKSSHNTYWDEYVSADFYPSKFYTLYPIGNITETPIRFEWEGAQQPGNISEPLKYNIYLSTEPDFSDYLIFETFGINFLEVSQILFQMDEKYYWYGEAIPVFGSRYSKKNENGSMVFYITDKEKMVFIPNPVKLRDEVIISGIMGYDKLYFYDIEGNLIFTDNIVKPTYRWDLRTKHKRRVGSGIYIVIAENESSKRLISKLAIIK